MQLDILHKEILIQVTWKITSLRNILTLILIKICRTKNENSVNIIYKLYYYYTHNYLHTILHTRILPLFFVDLHTLILQN